MKNKINAPLITSRRINLGPLVAMVSDPSLGAVATFVGIVRDHNAGRRVTSVSYDIFKPMAVKILTEIIGEAANRWNARVAAAHRLGRLRVGEVSVAVAAGAAHRAEAFNACRYVIDEIKTRLPVWKKEHYLDGPSQWLPGRALCDASHSNTILKRKSESRGPKISVFSS